MKNQGLKPDMVQQKNSVKGDKSGQKENPARNEKEEEGILQVVADKASVIYDAVSSAISPSSDEERKTQITNRGPDVRQLQQQKKQQQQQQQQQRKQHQQRNLQASHNPKNTQDIKEQARNISNPNAEKPGIKKSNPDQSSKRPNTGAGSKSKSILTTEENQEKRLQLGRQIEHRYRFIEIEKGKEYLKLLDMKRNKDVQEFKIEITGNSSSEKNKHYQIRFKQGINTMLWNTINNGQPTWNQRECGISGTDLRKLMNKREFISDLMKWGIIDES